MGVSQKLRLMAMGMVMEIENSAKLFRLDCGEIYLQEFSTKDAESIYNISNQPEIEKFLPDWKSTKEQRVNWVVNYEIPENKAFLHAVRTTTNIDDHILRLGIFKKTTNEFIGWWHRYERRTPFTKQRDNVCYLK